MGVLRRSQNVEDNREVRVSRWGLDISEGYIKQNALEGYKARVAVW